MPLSGYNLDCHQKGFTLGPGNWLTLPRAGDKSLWRLKDKMIVISSPSLWRHHSPHHVPAGSSLPRHLLVVKCRHPGTEAAVVRIVVTTLLLRLLQQPGSVPAHGLVPGGHVVLQHGRRVHLDTYYSQWICVLSDNNRWIVKDEKKISSYLKIRKFVTSNCLHFPRTGRTGPIQGLGKCDKEYGAEQNNGSFSPQRSRLKGHWGFLCWCWSNSGVRSRHCPGSGCHCRSPPGTCLADLSLRTPRTRRVSESRDPRRTSPSGRFSSESPWWTDQWWGLSLGLRWWTIILIFLIGMSIFVNKSHHW